MSASFVSSNTPASVATLAGGGWLEDYQVSLTDPDAQAMATSTSRGLVGYNVQTAVEAEHHLIVAHELTNIGSDRRQLAKMAAGPDGHAEPEP